ncbi:MAG: SET domain-containing protein-lysine N-methyltransferase, partial [Candidatus Pacebacteria bacterium]|nr:SET domain-containing protein-lysine N-methyltransferase [Candidatus Paceibacterota bacterium]
PLFVRVHAVQFFDTKYRWSTYGTLMNHSCEPNCGINGIGALFRLVTMKPINKGEELTFDYEMTEDSDWRMKCECGSPICRGIIGAYSQMPQNIKIKYSGYVADYLIEKYGEPA